MLSPKDNTVIMYHTIIRMAHVLSLQDIKVTTTGHQGHNTPDIDHKDPSVISTIHYGKGDRMLQIS